MAANEPVLNAPGTGRSVEFGNGSRAEVAVSGSQTGGEYAVLRYHVVAGDEPPVHAHSREDELLYVLDGEVAAVVNGVETAVGPGGLAVMARGVPHTVRVTGRAATLLVTFVPAGLERFVVPETPADADPSAYGLTFFPDAG